MDRKSYRMKEFFHPGDGLSLILDTSAGLSLGPLPGLEDFQAAAESALGLLDGLVTSPGQSRKLMGRNREQAALLIRVDWTNALRGEDFAIPPESIQHLQLLQAQHALDLGASGMVGYFLLGYPEEIEAQCLRFSVQGALEGAKVGMPLLVDVRPEGPRVVLRESAIELGVSYALESGADGVVIPWPGETSLQTITTMAAGAPIWIKPSSLESAPAEWESGQSLGVVGLWIDAGALDAPLDAEQLEALRAVVHPAPAENSKMTG
jgi:DhnA family fructose-bisphosphate aldolase class Ia